LPRASIGFGKPCLVQLRLVRVVETEDQLVGKTRTFLCGKAERFLFQILELHVLDSRAQPKARPL
jgi:hypothetical protein